MANIENNESNYDRVIETSIEDVIHNSMIPYAEYVILDRAIPRVEDGLKPVQRRILYAMYELGITPEKPTRKSARIVGDCLGKFHPHGDTSVYGALVRMGQPFSIRNCLIEGQGNFGSVDGDSAAAMRYTEARLTPLAMELLRDIDKNTVEFTNNFDDTLIEPVTLPGRFPNLLVNGASGIAVGLATNIPTHNLAEVIDGTIAMIKKPTISLAELMKYIPAPDFPTGGYIIKTDLEKAYETGRGKIMIRAKANIEKEKDKEMIVITELPYQVNKAVVQQKIIALRESQKDSKDSVILGINEVVDESDMNGTRVVIRVKKDYNCREILAELFRKTDLEVSFNINMVAIANGKPKTMSIIEILTAYIKYQMSVILRRAQYDYDDAKKREHILDGLVIAVNNIDEVIQIIKTSKNTPEAKIRLIERFILSSEQAQAILDMRLAKINTLEVFKLEQELADLKNLIEQLYEIIHNEEKRKTVFISELNEIKKKYGDERRSVIVDGGEEIVIRHQDDNIVEPCVVQLLANGELKRLTPDLVKKATKATNFKNELASIVVKNL
ncbi:MAG: DNA topoisomerase (ATP-hydrolyzing), partial [Clostridia bacterium]